MIRIDCSNGLYEVWEYERLRHRCSNAREALDIAAALLKSPGIEFICPGHLDAYLREAIDIPYTGQEPRQAIQDACAHMLDVQDCLGFSWEQLPNGGYKVVVS